MCHWNYQCLCACSIVRLYCDWGVLIPVVFVWSTCAIGMLGDNEIVDGGYCVSKDLLSVDEITDLEDNIYDRLVRKYEEVLCDSS